VTSIPYILPATDGVMSATPTFRNRSAAIRIFTRVATRPNSAARAYGPALLTVALVVYVAAYLSWPNLAGQVDLLVYRFGADRVLAGQDLYSSGLTGNPHTLLFDYTPFAALCFLPLALVTPLTAQILWLIGNCALVAYAVPRMLRGMGMTATTGLWSLGALLVGLVAWLEPIRLSLQLGQINLVILAVVVADLLGPSRRRWAGVGIGLVAGIKLTPALFIIYLLLIGRKRAALVASSTFVATVAAGFAVLPRDSGFFWLRRGFDDVARISSDPVANTSLRGLFIRLHWPVGAATAAALVLAMAALAIAVLAWRRGHRVLGVAIVGMASDAVSPFSWSHHWVWFAPLVVHLGHRALAVGSRWSLAALCAFWVTFAGWFVSVAGGSPETGLLAIRPGGTWDVWLPATYLLAFVTVLVAAAWWLRRPDRDYATGTDTAGVLYPVTRTQLAVSRGLGTTASSSTVSPGKTVT
jgi:alpha-1,2-mannosyltransferase